MHYGTVNYQSLERSVLKVQELLTTFWNPKEVIQTAKTTIDHRE